MPISNRHRNIRKSFEITKQEKSNPKYLKLTKEMKFNDLSGRWTTLVEGAIGYLLDEEEIIILPGGAYFSSIFTDINKALPTMLYRR